MSKPLIGLLCPSTEDEKFSVNRNYYAWLRTLGTVTFIDPFIQEIEPINLLVLPGGQDINPLRYMHYWPKEVTGPQRSQEYFDGVILPHYIEAKVPILGICRGMQSLNVVLGGSLHPHINEPTSYSEGGFAHYVHYDGIYYSCSSNHHQAVDRLGEDLEVIMTGYGSKTLPNQKIAPDPNELLQVEGFKHASLPILGFQFHPEKNHSASSCRKINVQVEKLIRSII